MGVADETSTGGCEEEVDKQEDKQETGGKVKQGKLVHIPGKVFPKSKVPKCGYWIGKTCGTKFGGTNDIGIHIEGEEIFTRPMAEVATWLV